ncbi:MAG: thioesterase [Candidatus Dactylopiibacterium carminicum]|uniref:Thioesterase n=1 Tax=Candidatus Dactylopiibacterium carminicum TaxID=857335 RepID=A0A272EV92_9RHOO|nr:acyl-CoA thioesterase [Candidatus Dactylopiibacterium carminicum]KAF7600144.1 acyl-CoA thioesterase [Candidatus Dactylopiibacterium carminicum]PAS94027.1 MAG: thioesterase [Candidatus Dactylopiibacterium carminicum]PAS98210.1 MAG: thioesterase [Candidatus Dactylopiibacterium carminicum]PAT00143.1 MAG: thioesterase [Candidatus Dactylopiibacterium carminicum]
MSGIHVQRFVVPASAIDLNRHVNNVEYLRWMQDVAIEHSTQMGWPMERYLRNRCSWVIRSHFIEYLRPALRDDELMLLTWVTEMGERSSVRKYRFWRPRDRQILARAETNWVFVDARVGLPRDILPEVRADFRLVADETEIETLLAELQPAERSPAI